MCNIVTDYAHCNCGAMTVYFDSGDSNSFLHVDKEKNSIVKMPSDFGIDLKEAKPMQTTYCCNHCVNKYGLDLCACGSGETPGDCTENFEECGNPYETLGESVKFDMAKGWNT